jgi:hypothetical protein
MNIDTINNFGVYLLLALEFYFMYLYMKYWLQILSIIKHKDTGLSLYSQKELNDIGMSGDFVRAYGMIFSNIGVSAKILFSPKIDNPKLVDPVKGARRSIFYFLVTPLIFAFVLIFVTALMQ